jgi:hypothetical protein
VEAVAVKDSERAAPKNVAAPPRTAVRAQAIARLLVFTAFVFIVFLFKFALSLTWGTRIAQPHFDII